jgi:hypothetical protein
LLSGGWRSVVQLCTETGTNCNASFAAFHNTKVREVRCWLKKKLIR